MELDLPGVQNAHSSFPPSHCQLSSHSSVGCWSRSVHNKDYLKYFHKSFSSENCLQIDSKAPLPLSD
jgi:hypothetical protein